MYNASHKTMKKFWRTYQRVLAAGLYLVLLAGCALPAGMGGQEVTLQVDLLYPTADSVVEMGNSIKGIVQVRDGQGTPVNDVRVTMSLIDPGGSQVAKIEMTPGAGDAYRSEEWTIPHRSADGIWSVVVKAERGREVGEASSSVQVENSTSEYLLEQYGFWLDAPRMRNIQSQLAAERGDAENGLIRWGGLLPNQHIFVENWVEIHWRKGEYGLDNSERVRRFLLEELGDLGFTPLREIGTFTPVKFKGWEAWQAPARGQLERYDMQWVVFYAPEVEKTYAIATTVVLGPVGVDMHAVLLESFEVSTEHEAQGAAPKPLLDLEPGPRLISPPLGSEFEGLEEPIVLEWEAVRELEEDEYYEVVVDYNYRESNFKVFFATQETRQTLPAELYSYPNCGVFNWRVTLKRHTGTKNDSRMVGESLSFPSLYWYVIWEYPTGEAKPFLSYCPNAQY